MLAIGFYGMEFPDDVTELVEEAILGRDLGGPSPYEEILFSDLLFAVRAVGDQDVDVQLRTHLANQFIVLWLANRGKGKYQSLQTRAQNIMAIIQDSQIGQGIIAALVTALKDENQNVRANAASALGNATNSAEAVTALVTALKDENENVRVKAAQAIRELTKKAIIGASKELMNQLRTILDWTEVAEAPNVYNPIFDSLNALSQFREFE